ncbi:MAG: exo-alpha-sialidase [Deltaproteobacteria bacterium]|nr:exo-alpha-sialidase [Deltaproteobacteria bacterium]
MKTAFRATLLLAGAAVAVGGLSLVPQLGRSAPSANNVIARELAIELGQAARLHHQRPLSSGPVYAALQGTGELARRAAAAAPQALSEAFVAPPPITQGCQNSFGGGQNIRVNQDCSLRRQAEEVIAVNPANQLNLIAGQNDSRIGFNHCGYDWSLDGGLTWGDLVPPFYQFQMLDGHVADVCSDPTATFDRLGNAYIAGILFDIASPASALVVAKSNAGIGGRYFHSPQPVPFQNYRTDPLGVVANDLSADVFNDKEFIVADASPISPKTGNVYVAWTRFLFMTGSGVGAHSPIYFSQSTDGGATWSPGIEISGANPAICSLWSAEPDPNACDQNQGPHPIVGRDGAVYVAFNNGNTPALGINQYLITSCPPTADCSNVASWTTPVKIADDIGTQPIGPDAATGCPAGRQCLPPNGYRVTGATAGSLSIDRNDFLYLAWADYRNGGGTCPPLGNAATATPPCDNDVFYAFSTDGGATWSAPRNITPASRFGANAQWQPWSAVSPNGAKLWVGYYDRSYDGCEALGCNDITLAKVAMPASGAPTYTYTRVTTASMPNLVVANNPLQAGFLGDYIWVTVDKRGRPYIVWADTRGLGGTVEEDIYFRPPPS